MNKNQETKEKICAFYASDYHFEMMSLPYINKKIDENNEIVILTENNLEETIKTLLSKMNLENQKKEKILEINWNNNNLDKFKKIKLNIEQEKNTIIFIKGKENYIKNVNKNIEKWTEYNKEIKVIDCYDMEEIGEKINDIIVQYNKVLNTSGEKNVKKL